MSNLKEVPNFVLHNVTELFNSSPDMCEFLVRCGETNIRSIDAKLLSTKMNNIYKNEQLEDASKFLQKLKPLKKEIFSNLLPKYIITIPCSTFDFRKGEENNNVKIFELLSDMFGADRIKIPTPRTSSLLLLEIWLLDDGELATFDFYKISNKDLFYKQIW
jgi:hypothetical protein